MMKIRDRRRGRESERSGQAGLSAVHLWLIFGSRSMSDGNAAFRYVGRDGSEGVFDLREPLRRVRGTTPNVHVRESLDYSTIEVTITGDGPHEVIADMLKSDLVRLKNQFGTDLYDVEFEYHTDSPRFRARLAGEAAAQYGPDYVGVRMRLT